MHISYRIIKCQIKVIFKITNNKIVSNLHILWVKNADFVQNPFTYIKVINVSLCEVPHGSVMGAAKFHDLGTLADPELS